MNIYQNRSQEIVRLSLDNTTLIGKYSEGVAVVMVELFSDTRAFSVQLPSLFTEYQTQFFFKNYGSNAVTLLTSNSEMIDTALTTTHVISAGAFFSILPDNIDRWVSLENL